MEYRKFGNQFVVRMDKGEEIITTLTKLCKECKITLGSVTAVGAVNKATIGLMDTKTKQYKSDEFTGDLEITSLVGNISRKNGEVYLHLHANLGDDKHNVYGGHLSLAVVSVTCEMIINSIEGEVGREFNEEVGLNLFKF